MRRARTLLILGVWVAVLPHLGFPNSWKNILFLLTGLSLAYFSYMLYKESKKDIDQTKPNTDTFSENKNF